MGGLPWVLGGAWLLVSLLATVGVWMYWQRVQGPAPGEDGIAAPDVVVLVPVRGDTGLREFLACLRAQRYRGAWRVIFAVEAEEDAATAPLRATLVARERLVVAGSATACGQKVRNLLAAWEAAGGWGEIIVTLDADTRPRADWLAQLTRPLRAGVAEVASGYRWSCVGDGVMELRNAAPHPGPPPLRGRGGKWRASLPLPRSGGGLGWGLSANLVALADRSVATVPRFPALNLAWGGSTAIRRDTAGRIGLLKAWEHAVSDDFTLWRAARRARLRIYAPLRVLVASPLGEDPLGFARRQYKLARWHATLHWLIALAALLPATLGALALLPALIAGHPAAIGIYAAAILLQQARASLRIGIARQVAPEAVRHPRLLLPLAQVLHLAVLLSSAVGRTLRWAGREYRRGG